MTEHPTTPQMLCWTTYHILQPDIIILHGSAVTHLSCSGLFPDKFTANLLTSVPVEEFWKKNQSTSDYIMTNSEWFTSLDHHLHDQ